MEDLLEGILSEFTERARPPLMRGRPFDIPGLRVADNGLTMLVRSGHGGPARKDVVWKDREKGLSYSPDALDRKRKRDRDRYRRRKDEVEK